MVLEPTWIVVDFQFKMYIIAQKQSKNTSDYVWHFFPLYGVESEVQFSARQNLLSIAVDLANAAVEELKSKIKT